MSRIHKILAKAERDGTARRFTLVSEPGRFDRSGDLTVVPARRPCAADAADWAGAAVPDQSPSVDTIADASPLVTAKPVFGARLHTLLVAAHAASSAAAEQFRSLRTRIAQAEGSAPRRVILVTSPGAGDGKSVTVANLGLTMAQEFQRRILMVDANLRSARLHALLGISRAPGLVDVLTGASTLEEALVSLPEHRLIVLPAGRPYDRPTELLASGPMRRLIDDLRRRFDRLLVDTAAAYLADAGVIEPAADGVLLVVRAGRTTKPAIERGLGLLPSSKVLGFILNDSREAGRGRASLA